MERERNTERKGTWDKTIKGR